MSREINIYELVLDEKKKIRPIGENQKTSDRVPNELVKERNNEKDEI